MNINDIETALRSAAGNPDSGAVADVIPAMTAAIADLAGLTPKAPAKEKRIIESAETR